MFLLHPFHIIGTILSQKAWIVVNSENWKCHLRIKSAPFLMDNGLFLEVALASGEGI